MAKAFRITDGKGFQVTFENGYTVSVQFGWGNYCDNYDNPRIGGYKEENIRLGESGSNTAETALLDSDGNFIEYEDGDVQGRRTATEVLELLNYAASLPAKARGQQ